MGHIRWVVRAGSCGQHWVPASSTSAVVRDTTNQTIWLKLYLHYYFGWPSSSLHTSGSHHVVEAGSAARLGLCSIVIPSERSCQGRRAMYLLPFPVPPSWGCSSCSNANATEGEMRGEIYRGKCFLWKGSVLRQITKAELHGSYWFTLFYPSFIF